MSDDNVQLEAYNQNKIEAMMKYYIDKIEGCQARQKRLNTQMKKAKTFIKKARKQQKYYEKRLRELQTPKPEIPKHVKSNIELPIGPRVEAI